MGERGRRGRASCPPSFSRFTHTRASRRDVARREGPRRASDGAKASHSRLRMHQTLADALPAATWHPRVPCRGMPRFFSFPLFRELSSEPQDFRTELREILNEKKVPTGSREPVNRSIGLLARSRARGGQKRRRGPRLCRSTREVHEEGQGGGRRCAAMILIVAARGAVARRTTVLRRRGATPRSFSRFSRRKPCRRLLPVEVSTRSALFVSELIVRFMDRSTNKAVECITGYFEI